MPETPSATVDVLIPVYNAEPTIAEAVESILNQTFRDLRVVVVDDGSTDGTPAILRELAARDPRVHVVTRQNGGIVNALNTGLSHCTAEFLARHDGDDIAAPHRLQVEIDYLRGHPDCVAVSADARHIDVAGNPIGTRSHMAKSPPPNPARVPSLEPGLLHPFLLARRAAVQQVGGYRYVFHAEDIDLYWRLMRLGRLHVLPDLLGDYRIHPQSIMSGSIVNGRIAALNSQLASLSELRRRAGEPDLDFPEGAVAEYRRLGRLDAMIEAASKPLSPDERRYLSIATAVKVLDLTFYRPYELDAEDARFIRDAIERHRGILSPENAREVRHLQIQTMTRLRSQGKLDLAMAVTPPRLWVPTLAWLLGNKARKTLRKLWRGAPTAQVGAVRPAVSE